MQQNKSSSLFFETDFLYNKNNILLFVVKEKLAFFRYFTILPL